MGEVINYSVILGLVTLIFEAIVLLKTEQIERVLLNDKKKLVLHTTRIAIIGFGISLILYPLFVAPKTNHESTYYLTTLIASFIIAAEAFYIINAIVEDTGFRKNYFLKDDTYGKLYLIKNTSSGHILLADKPRAKDSEFSIFMDESFIKEKKIFVEQRKIRRILFSKKKSKV